jgi:hypothetical protein
MHSFDKFYFLALELVGVIIEFLHSIFFLSLQIYHTFTFVIIVEVTWIQ